jgi:hypothetical protein
MKIEVARFSEMMEPIDDGTQRKNTPHTPQKRKEIRNRKTLTVFNTLFTSSRTLLINAHNALFYGNTNSNGHICIMMTTI